MRDLRAFVAPALYLITDRRATRGRPLTEVLAAALRGAGDYRRTDGRLPLAISLREKDLPAADLCLLARAILGLTRKAGADLYVNGRLDVALACGAEGVHLPGDGFVPSDVRRVACGLRVGVSTHTNAAIGVAGQDGADFVVFGPIFRTASKPEMLTTHGLNGLAAATAQLSIPVLALGGITPGVAHACREAGASGLACIGAVMGAADPEAETRSFLAGFAPKKPA